MENHKSQFIMWNSLKLGTNSLARMWRNDIKLMLNGFKDCCVFNSAHILKVCYFNHHKFIIISVNVMVLWKLLIFTS